MNLFAIDSLYENALQWAISSQTGKEGLLTRKNLTADDTDNTDFHRSEKERTKDYRGLTRMSADLGKETEMRRNNFALGKGYQT